MPLIILISDKVSMYVSISISRSNWKKLEILVVSATLRHADR